MRRYLSTPVTWTWSTLSYNSPFVSVNILDWTQPGFLTQPTDTHHTESFAQQHRCCRSAASRRGLAGEPSETLTMEFPRCSMSITSSQTLTTLDLSCNSIGDAGAQHLGEALRVNQVRHWRWDVLCPPSSQTLTSRSWSIGCRSAI